MRPPLCLVEPLICAALLGLLSACGPSSITRVTPRPILDLPSPLPTLTAASPPTGAPPSATPEAGRDPQGTTAPAVTLPASATHWATETATVPTPSPPTPTPGASVEITMFNYRFSPAEITVQQGATLRLILRNPDHVLHALTIPDVGFARVVQGGDTAEVDLYADVPPGSYYLYCPIQEEGNHEDSGMVGTLIVVPAP